jgi:transcriptional regulator with XRE-family HTH domain
MANERVRGNDVGPTGRTVGANIARVRKGQQMSLGALEARLAELGRRISLSGLSKIENGDRRVDVDDLMAIAIALDVTPNGLLLPTGEPGDIAEVTGARGSVGLFWQWAGAESTPFSRDKRAFVVRSLPYWMDDPAPSMTWYGSLTLSMGVGGGDPEKIETHKYTAKTPAEVDWDRVRR